MKNIFLVIVIVLIAIHSGFSKIPRDTRDYKVAPGEIVVKMKNTYSQSSRSQQQSILSKVQSDFRFAGFEKLYQPLPIEGNNHSDDIERIYIFKTSSATDIEALAVSISQDPAIEYAEPHFYFRTHVAPNDPLYSQVYPLNIVKADSAWNVQRGDSSVIIGVIDSGVDWDHPDLAAAIWNNTGEIPNNGIDDDGNGYVDDIRGWDFVANVSDAASGEDGVGEDNNPMDFDGHGTHVSGIAAGVTNNSIGISSLSWGCRIMPLRCGWRSTDGNGYVSSVYAAKAYIYAANNGASVVNQSSGTSNVVLDGARYAYRNGVVITNSAGNSNSDFAASLGSEPWALSVAATNSVDGKASYSSYNKKVNISAPGGDFSSANRKGFLSTVVNPSSFYGGVLYTEFQGTSMAAPFVASLAALIKSKNKTWTPAQVMFQITGTADNIDGINPLYAGKLGSGRINALRAVTETPPPPKPDLEFVSFAIDDAAGGNGNGFAEPGENIGIIVAVKNNWGDATNVSAILSSEHWSANITKSSSAIGLVRGISNLDSNQRNNSTDKFIVSLNANAIPETIPFTLSVNAAGGYNKQFSFEISVGARILLVDDDDGVVNVEQYYGSALKSLGASYDRWDHASAGTPSLALLQKYSAVFWSCEWAFPSLDSSDRAVIAAYLNGGGRLFISGQDIGWDLADLAGLEYESSAGASKTFLEQYLKAKYISDDAVTGNVVGVTGDSLGDGLSFARFQPMRGSTEQYPDVLDTTGGSVFSFKYADGGQAGKGAAISYSGSYKLLYFGFGGFESISDPAKRVVIMDRILRWMFEYSISADTLPNSENVTNPYPVTAEIHSSAQILSTELVYQVNGTVPYSRVPLSLANGIYAASIPAQSANSLVSYFVLAKSTLGYLPFTRSTFFVGLDTIRPIVTVLDTIKNSIKAAGPYSISTIMVDDIGIDTTTAMIKYKINGGSEMSASMTKILDNTYRGDIVPPTPLSSGDIVTYHIIVNDVSQLKNSGRYPLQGERQFLIGREMVDDFEDPLSGKWDLGNWNYTPKQRFRGAYSITDSPDSSYKPNINRIATYNRTLDLTPFSKAMLTLYQRYNIHTSDTAFIDVTHNGTDWVNVRTFSGVNLFWKKENIDLSFLTGGINSQMTVRLRIKSDGANESDGIYIDEIEILTDQLTTTVDDASVQIPTQYSLAQNYPNPFNPVTTIQFSLPVASPVSLTLYDVLGREVKRMIDDFFEAGVHSYRFDSASLASGLYYYRMSTGSYSNVKKMVLIK